MFARRLLDGSHVRHYNTFIRKGGQLQVERPHRTRMELTENTIYRHDELGDVLVLGVHHIFETYDPDAGDGRLRSRVVRYTTEWDDYGPLPSSVRTTPVERFQAGVGDAVRTWTGSEWSTNGDS